MWLFGVLFLISSAVGDVPYLLPKTSVPSHYDLSVRIFPESTNYTGNLQININVLEETKTIVLHAKNLIIESDNVAIQNSERVVKLHGLAVNDENDFLTLKFESVISPGNYELKIENFIGDFYDTSKGFCLSYYFLQNGKKNFLVAAAMEPAYARMAFPCYDEPNLKATFNVTIIHPIGYHAVSNMPSLYSVETEEKLMKTSFQETPKMSTYQLSISVSDFVSSNTTHNGKLLRFLVKANDKSSTKLVLSFVKRAIKYGEEMFNVSYSLPKLDSIVVPTFNEQFALENWGLIVYGEAIIVKNETIKENSLIPCYTICHEIAHQWFGNLVTLDWWDYLWLNEGFSNYYAERIAEKIIPSHKFTYWPYYGELQNLKVYEQSINATDNLNRHVSKTVDFTGKFSILGYYKGSAIVRFMSLVFPNFDTAITHYLRDNSFGNVKPSDVFKAISDHTDHSVLPAGATVEGIMNNWVNYPGYPVIHVNITKSGNQRVIHLSQERYLVDGKSSQKWWIPITLTTQEDMNFYNLKPITWLSDDGESKTVTIEGGDGWVLVNLRQMVYCRVNYDAKNWQKLIDYILGPNKYKVHALNRKQFYDDGLNFGKLRKGKPKN